MNNVIDAKPLVHVLLAAFNGELYLRQQLDSIFNQSHQNWKLLISDDGSTDETNTIISSYKKLYPNKIEIVENNSSYGNVRSNFFNLMKHSHADYIMFCDQDDFWEINKIELNLKEMLRLESCNIKSCPILVFTDLKVVDSDLKPISPSFMKFSKLDVKKTSLNQLLIQNVVSGCTMMINENLRSLSLEYSDEKEIIMHDWWIAIVASCFGICGFLNISPIKYRQHNKNVIGAKKIYNIKYIFNKIFVKKDIKLLIIQTTNQAKHFFKTYKSQLSAEKLVLLREYSSLYNYCKIKRIIVMLKHKVFKHDIMRIIGQFIWG